MDKWRGTKKNEAEMRTEYLHRSNFSGSIFCLKHQEYMLTRVTGPRHGGNKSNDVCFEKTCCARSKKNLGDNWNKNPKVITYKTWMSLHLLSQIDADRWGVQQTLNCYLFCFKRKSKNVFIGSTAVDRFQCRINHHYWN